MKYRDVRRNNLMIVGHEPDDKWKAAANVHDAAFRVMARHGSKVSRWSQQKFRNHVAYEATGIPLILTWLLPSLISWALTVLIPMLQEWLSQRVSVPRANGDESIEQELRRLGMESEA